MPDSDEYRIKVSVDSAGVASGVDETIGQLGSIKGELADVGDASDEAADKSSKLVHELGGMRESQRVAHDLYEIIAGAGEGSVAGGIQGVTGLIRVLLATSEGFDPLLLAFAIVASSLAGIVSQHSKVKESAESSKKAEEDLGKASEEASEKRIAAIGRVVDAFDQVMRSEDAYRKELDREAGYYQKAIEDTEKLIAARAKLAVAELEHQRQIALGNAKTKEEVEAINERYKNLIEGVESQSSANILNQKVKASAQDIADKTGSQSRAKEDLAADQEELQQKQNAAAKAQQEASNLGVQPDAAGSYAGIRKQLGKELDDLVHESKAHPYDSRINEQLYEVGQKLAAANRANDATQGLSEFTKKVVPDIEKLTKKIEDLASAIARAKTDNQILQVEQATAAQTAQTKSLADQQAQQTAAAKEAYENQRAQLEAELKERRTQQENPALTADQKAGGHASIDSLQAQIAQLELDNARVLNLSQAQKTGLRADVKTDQERAVFDVQGQEKKDSEHQLKAEIEQLKKQIAASTNNPEILRGAKMVEASLANDPAKELPALQSLLAQATAAGFKSIDTKVRQNHSELKPKVEKLRKDVTDLWGAVRSLSTGMS